MFILYSQVQICWFFASIFLMIKRVWFKESVSDGGGGGGGCEWIGI